jgi:organic hydroperoxide reductase OsmC/OhrA
MIKALPYARFILKKVFISPLAPTAYMERANPEVVTYTLRADWDEQSGAEITTRGITIKVDLPPEFGGLGRHLAPDELFLGAIAGCLMITFLHFRKTNRLKLRLLQCTISSRRVQTGQGYRLQDIRATLRIRVDKDQVDVGRKCIELARNYCPLLADLSSPLKIDVEGEIEVAS